MGNSGSVHHMQSGLKELHSYYQVQTDLEDRDDLSFLNEEPNPGVFYKEQTSLPRSKFSRIPSSSRHFDYAQTREGAAKNSQVKVLPNLSENLRLRSTTNGAILQSGGTISGRRDSLLPQPIALGRSKTFITESVEKSLKDIGAPRLMTRRSQTQLNIDLRKGNRSQLQDNNSSHLRRFTSTLELKPANDSQDQDASVCNSSETYQKLSKVKLKNKKRKAPPAPPVQQAQEIPITADATHREIERKQRLFKTKFETVFQGSINARQQSVNSKPSSQLPPDNLRASYRVNHKKPVALMNSGFRREKSFDSTLLSSRSKEASGQAKTSSTTQRISLQLSSSADLKTDFKTERREFKIELEAATKTRLMTKSGGGRTSDYKLPAKEASARQREPNSEKPKPGKHQTPPRSTKPETQTKIPQLKKTFYFGMESSKRKTVDSCQTLDTYEPKQDAIVSATDGDAVYSLNQKYSSETNDNGIQVSVRPSLPRRQLEIPRFSPVTAWRTLSEEYRRQSIGPAGSPIPSNINTEAVNTFLIEDRIYRTYREPCPFYPDNKSGDSGISGDDAYLPKKPIQPRNLLRNECDELIGIANVEGYAVDDINQPIKVVGPFLTPWTPQQDLEEEDTSSDGDAAMKLVESQCPASAHVFSLSLPRENQLSAYGEKTKPDFRSLQKLKRSTSEELNGSICDCTQSSADSNLFGLGNYRSDNWVLSKTGAAPNTNEPVTAYCNRTDSNKKSSYFDLSVSIQPMSLGCLATGKHVMYLPNRPIEELKKQSVVIPPTDDDSLNKNIRGRNKRFSFQSSVRQIERRRLAEKLSKDAEQKEALRKSELEAMRRVEEEFQRKRAYEKASIRHQLRLYSMDDDNFTSLPVDYSQNFSGFRAEPDGAVSSTSVSPVLRTNEINEDCAGGGAYLVWKRNVVENSSEYRWNVFATS